MKKKKKDSWRCELDQQDRWETRSFAAWLAGFHGERNLHILGWLTIIDADSFSQSHIQPKTYLVLASQASFQPRGQNLPNHGQLGLRRMMEFCGCLPKACENSVVSEILVKNCKYILKPFYFLKV